MGAPKGNQYAAGNPNSGRPLRFSDEDLERMAVEMVQWAKTSDAIVYREWMADREICYSVAHSLKERSKVFAKAIEVTKYIIGVRREKLNIKGELPDKSFCSYMALYDPEMKDWLLEQKRADDRSKLTKIVIEDGRGNMRIEKNVLE